MKTDELENKPAETELRSLEEFTKRFYPQPVKPEIPDFPDAEDTGEKLAKESLDRLQAALLSK